MSFPSGRDPVTGVTISDVAPGPQSRHHLPFSPFTTTSDGGRVVFVAREEGLADLMVAGLPGTGGPEGGERRLTNRRGVNPFSGVITADDLAVLFTAGDSVCGVTIADGAESLLAGFPEGRPGNLALSPDGRSLALTVRERDGTRLAEMDLYTANVRMVAEGGWSPAWAQYDPSGSFILLSGPAQAGVWAVSRDDGHERLIYQAAAGEWVAHPRWLDGNEALFVKMHEGLFAASLTGAVRVLFRGPVWHPAVRADSRLVVFDTRDPDLGLVLVSPRTCRWRVLCYPRSSGKGKRWSEVSPAPGPWNDPSVLPEGRMADWDAETAYGPEWTHPHPVFSVDGTGVFFTSDTGGRPRIYLARIPPEWIEELVRE